MIKLAISIGTLSVGGAETFVYNLLSELDYSKFKVLLIVLSKNNQSFLDKALSKLDIKIIYLNKKEGFSPSKIIKTYSLLKEFKPNILHGNIGGLIYFLPFVFMNNVKMIHTSHTLANFEFGPVKRSIIKSLYKKNKIIPIAISPEVRKSIIETYRIDERLIKLIYNGVDIDRFINQNKIYTNDVTICNVGRFETVKNHKVIIEVYRNIIKRYENTKLKLIGNGSLFNEILDEVSLVNNKNIVVIKETDRVDKELIDADIFFMPSLYEGLPLSVIEAMASGLIIVASSVGGLVDLVEDGVNGYLINDCMNVDGFSKIIEKLIVDIKLRRVISENNMIKARNFDIKIMVMDYQNIYLKEGNNA